MSNYYRTLNEGLDKYINEVLEEKPASNNRVYLKESRQLNEAQYIIRYYIDNDKVSKEDWDQYLKTWKVTLDQDSQNKLNNEQEIEVTEARNKSKHKIRIEKEEVVDTTKEGSRDERKANKKADKLAKRSMDKTGEVRSDYKLSVSMQGEKAKLQLGDKIIAVYPSLQILNNVVKSLTNQIDNTTK